MAGILDLTGAAPRGGLLGGLNDNAILGYLAGALQGGNVGQSIGRGLEGWMHGTRLDEQRRVPTQTYAALAAAGLPDALAKAAALNPSVMKAVAPGYFGEKPHAPGQRRSRSQMAPSALRRAARRRSPRSTPRSAASAISCAPPMTSTRAMRRRLRRLHRRSRTTPAASRRRCARVASATASCALWRRHWNRHARRLNSRPPSAAPSISSARASSSCKRKSAAAPRRRPRCSRPARTRRWTSCADGARADRCPAHRVSAASEIKESTRATDTLAPRSGERVEPVRVHLFSVSAGGSGAAAI
jgi:hypothetical protein